MAEYNIQYDENGSPEGTGDHKPEQIRTDAEIDEQLKKLDKERLYKGLDDFKDIGHVEPQEALENLADKTSISTNSDKDKPPRVIGETEVIPFNEQQTQVEEVLGVSPEDVKRAEAGLTHPRAIQPQTIEERIEKLGVT